MKESDLSFIFVGDTESNWLEESFGLGYRFSNDFMNEWFNEYTK